MKFVGFGGELFRPFLLLGAGVKSVYFYLHLGAEFHVFIWLAVFVRLAVPGYIQPLGMSLGIPKRVVATPSFSTC